MPAHLPILTKALSKSVQFSPEVQVVAVSTNFMSAHLSRPILTTSVQVVFGLLPLKRNQVLCRQINLS